LWIGMSVLSMAEIIELVFLVADMVKKKKRPVTPTAEKDKTKSEIPLAH